MNKYRLWIPAGVLFGNWVMVPLLFPGRTHTQGFFIGLIAAVLLIGYQFCSLKPRH